MSVLVSTDPRNTTSLLDPTPPDVKPCPKAPSGAPYTLPAGQDVFPPHSPSMPPMHYQARLVRSEFIPDAKPTRCQPGDLWLLGRHRLLIGDATHSANWRSLLSIHLADMILTDPPYLVDLAEKNDRYNRTGRGKRCQRPVIGDTAAETSDPKALFRDAVRHVALQPYNTAYAFIGGTQAHNLAQAMEEAGFKQSAIGYVVWRKNQAVLTHGDYNGQHELIWYGWKGKHRFYGGTTAKSVIDCPRNVRNEYHAAQKPLPLLKTFMAHGCPEEGLVVDPFAGSGQTLFAAEETGRYFAGMEIDPVCGDIILDRWVDMGGDGPELLTPRLHDDPEACLKFGLTFGVAPIQPTIPSLGHA